MYMFSVRLVGCMTGCGKRMYYRASAITIGNGQAG
jgi:hypothetical protein